MTINSSAGPARQETPAIDVWLATPTFADDRQRHAFQALLSQDERIRLQRFVANDARDQFLAARVLLRTALSTCADVPPTAWSFGAAPFGKPCIVAPKDGRNLHFNVSHTAGLVACAISRHGEIGIDVENTQGAIDPLAIADHAFAPAETEMLKQLDGSRRLAYFHSLWTLKEAYIKARASGLSFPLDAFWFELGDGSARAHFSARCRDAAENWHFFQRDITAHHKLALAVPIPANQVLDVRFRWATPQANHPMPAHSTGAPAFKMHEV